MIVLDMLTGGGLVILGVLLGRFLPARKRGPKTIQPVCGCTHEFAFHDPKTSECHASKRLGYWAGEDHFETCTCRQYSGPQPLPEYFAPEIGSTGG